MLWLPVAGRARPRGPIRLARCLRGGLPGAVGSLRVDTSVWIRFLANRKPYGAELDRLLDQDEVAGHDLIYGELLIGNAGGREELLKWYGLMHRVPGVPHAEVVSFVRTRKLYGRGIGWVDAHLLASALVANAPIWTADLRLARLAGELGIAYSVSIIRA